MSNIAFLILSCDKYKDLWPGYFYQFDKYFDLEIPVYFSSNEISPNIKNPKVQNIKSGPDIAWGSSFQKILDQIEEEYVLVTLEDLYFCTKIDRQLFSNIYQFINGNNVVRHLKYTGFIRGEEEVMTNIRILNPDTPYRVTLCGVWQKKYLQSILLSKENPWQFEVNGSTRTKFDHGFFALDQPLFQTVNLVEKGFWIRKSISWALKEKIPINKKSRRYKNIMSEIFSEMRNTYFIMLMKIPIKIKVKIINAIKKILIMN